MGRKRIQKYSKKTLKKTKKYLDEKANVFYILQNVKVILMSPAQDRKEQNVDDANKANNK